MTTPVASPQVDRPDGAALPAPTALHIGGRWVAASDGATFAVLDPATGREIAAVASASVDDARSAIDAAESAARAWRQTSPRDRAAVLLRAFDAMQARKEEIAALIVRESGKSWADAVGEVDYASEFLRWYGEEAVRIRGEIGMSPAGDKRIVALRQPVGIALLVTPWNFPAAMATRKIGPALAAGCTVVLKPASDTPLTALLLAEVFQEAGAPDGVVNVIPSRQSGTVVSAMLADPRVRKLSFTGSTEVGRTLLAQAAQRVVNCSMELGGNAPLLVFEDADLDLAVEGAMVAKMRNAGESCIAANRLFVHESILDEFAGRLAERMAALRVGPGLDRANQVGPVINEAARDGIARAVDAAAGRGAHVATGGTILPSEGWFYPPTVLVGVAHDDPILASETFGPVAPIATFATEQEAVELANDTEFGLAAYVFTADMSRALRVSEAIEAGVVGINRGFVSDPAAPFGGMRQSGIGREGGTAGIEEFLETKYLAVAW